MDRIDKKILEILQTDGRISNQDLADRVALSPSPCLRRVKQLEDDGYIKHYVALLDPNKINLQLTIIVTVGLDNHDAANMQHFEETIQNYPEIVQCYLIAGQAADYLLKVVVPDLAAYEYFLLKKLTSIKGVAQVHSSFVLRRIIDTTHLPLDQCEM